MELQYSYLPPLKSPKIDDPFILDIFDLLDRERQGHMEKWEYASPRFKNDPTSGAEAWAKLIAKPGNYYPPQGDINTISHAINSKEFIKSLNGIETVVELGPGCKTSLSKKTLPIVQSIKNVNSYIAIDGTDDVADGASSFIEDQSNISGYGQSMDFFTQPLNKSWDGQSLMIFWGSTLGNFDGHAAENPFKKLVKFLQNIRIGLDKSDRILFSFDTEENEKNIIQAYSEKLMSAQILSVVHQMNEHIDNGNFDPYAWKHRTMWINASMQCANVLLSFIHI